MDTPAI